MTVRQFIWAWQSAEFVAIWVLGQLCLGLTWPLALLFAVGTMLALRGLLLGVVCVLIAGHFSQQRLSPVQWGRYWAGEVTAFICLYGVTQVLPRRWFRPVDDVSEQHVILAHGFLCNDGFWFRLIPRLHRAGFSVSTVEMREAFASIDDLQRNLGAEIQRVSDRNPNAQITLIGFSMGGLAARRLPYSVQQRCRLIAIYTPHYGSLLAHLTRPLKALNGRQMQPGSTWLRGLNQSADGFERKLGFWTHHDTVVVPPMRSRPCFAERSCAGKGHLSAALDADLHWEIVEWIRQNSQ